MNQLLIITGKVATEPELRYTPQSTALLKFNVPANRSYKQGEEWKTETTWFTITVWGQQAETVNKYIKKGDLVVIHGRLQSDQTEGNVGNPRIWNDQTGSAHARYEVNAEKVLYDRSKHKDEQPAAGQIDAFEQSAPTTPAADDLPF